MFEVSNDIINKQHEQQGSNNTALYNSTAEIQQTWQAVVYTSLLGTTV